ncbi:MAG: hypothetical protein NZM31_02735 [Gemmatales bacterium]|nr:hypothetical protein [Gemmatales bacterium]MDW8385916.1 hypothetical protein [Gemmatales bacterium]
MNKPRITTPQLRPSEATAPTGLWAAWVRFWFTPTDPTGLHALRLLTGLLVLTWLLGFAGQENALFGLRGWFDTQAYKDASRLPNTANMPAPITWSLVYLCGEDENLVTALYWSSVLVVALFTLGVATRITSVMTWLAVASFTANPAISYDGDVLLLMLTFYLMIGYVLLGWWHGDLKGMGRLIGGSKCLILGPSDKPPSVAANVAVRLIQVHFAIIVVVSALHKLQSGDWWSGTALWYPLFPPFQTKLAEIREMAPRRDFYLVALSLATYAALLWQLAFPFFAWRPRWRIVLLGGAVVGWIGTAFVYKLPIFGPAYLIGALSYLTEDEWRFLTGWLRRLPILERIMGSRQAPSAEMEARRSVKSAVTTG